jgi:acyl carrier protein
MDIVGDIRTFLATELSVADAKGLDPEMALVRNGIIDSIELMQIVMFIEERFGIEIDETEILPANFRSLTAMDAFVRSKIASC